MGSRRSALEGMRVAVTRPRAQADVLTRLVQEAGGEVIALPTIEISDPESWAPLDAALARLGQGAYEWTLFTSANSVRSVLRRLPDVSSLGRTRVAAVGGVTARVLEDAGAEVALVPPDAHGVALAEALGAGPGTILLPRVMDAPQALVDRLRAAGWDVDEVPAYRTLPGAPPPTAVEEVRRGAFDAVTFASPSAAANFVDLVARPEPLGLSAHPASPRIVACLGPVTARVARGLGFRVDVVASRQNDEGLVEALCDYLEQVGGTQRHANIER